MDKKTVNFNNAKQGDFFRQLRLRVNTYFKENNITRFGNSHMVIKTVFMILLYGIPLAILSSGIVTSMWVMYPLWVIMGFGMSGIGLSVMHDANHGSYSKKKWVNNMMGNILALIGGYHINWKIQHNVLHHSYTNVEGYDMDIEHGAMRFSPNQKRKPVHRFQMIYAPILYGLLTLNWVVAKDIIQIIQFNKRDLLKTQGISFRKALINVIFVKSLYLFVTLILPVIMLPFGFWQIFLGFLIMHYISGLMLALIFQSAHVLEETEFFETDEEGNTENSWAVHQMKTTANFARGSRIFSWFIGGLNYQIEHHLFPNISHIHYKSLSPIIKSTAEEFNVPYNEHKTFAGAVRSHLKLLRDLGKKDSI